LTNTAYLKSRKDSRRIPKSSIGLALVKFVTSVTGFSKIIGEINAQPGDIFITKGQPNAFYNTALHDELKKRNVSGIVLAGVSTSSGVEGTARAAAERGYNVSFATDAMTDRSMDAHQNSIRVIFPRLGELGTVSDIIEKLSSRT
ncbi:MAG: cysteine hydrolase family protein, partial [Bacteroidia bacterium]